MFFQTQKEDQFTFLQTATQKEKFSYGIFMWFMLFFGYMIFCTNWIIMGKLEGGWKGSLLSSSGSETTIEAVNYSVPFARGMATIPVAWLMVKLSHKRAVLLAMLLNTAAFPLVFAPHFSLFVIGRMIMACGGTMLIIFIQPILARFFDAKQKGYLSIFNSWAYVLGALLANFIFIDKSTVKTLELNWKTVACICGIFSYFPLIWYALFAKNFKTTDNAKDEIDQVELPQNTYSGIIKEKSLWFWIFWYSFLLVASVMISNFAPKMIAEINSELVSSGLGSSGGVDWKSLYTICFYLGCLCGFTLGRWNKTQFQRKPFVVLCCFLGLFFWQAIMAAVTFSKGGTNSPISVQTATGIIFASVFLFAFFSMGIQTVILYIPHEYAINNNAKRLTIFYSYLWGIGYVIFALYYVITAAVFDADKSGSGSGKGFYGPRVASLLSTLFVALFGVFSLFIKEPRPEWRKHPWDKTTPVTSLNPY